MLVILALLHCAKLVPVLPAAPVLLDLSETVSAPLSPCDTKPTVNVELVIPKPELIEIDAVAWPGTPPPAMPLAFTRMLVMRYTRISTVTWGNNRNTIEVHLIAANESLEDISRERRGHRRCKRQGNWTRPVRERSLRIRVGVTGRRG